ncbi:MAG: chromophore lyase CpcT/CpeT [Alphaproteobacteria bacterium]
MRLICLLSIATLAVTACSANVATLSDTERFAKLYETSFETPADSTEAYILDRRVRINSEALPGVWFYSQLNTGETKKLYRQRVYNIVEDTERGGLTQKTYVLNDASAFEDVWDSPEKLAELTRNDFKPLFDVGCEPFWIEREDKAWSGYVDPKDCIIDSKRRNTQIRIESESFLSSEKYQTTERGYDFDMNFLWGSKPGEVNTLYPVR